VAAGFVLPADGEATVRKAAGSIVGFGLECCLLCEDSRQFPIHPSSSLLRDQTSFLAFLSNEALVQTLEEVTRNIATGYTFGTDPKGAASFAKSHRRPADVYRPGRAATGSRPPAAGNRAAVGRSGQHAHPADRSPVSGRPVGSDL
jgi:hypothetical protein